MSRTRRGWGSFRRPGSPQAGHAKFFGAHRRGIRGTLGKLTSMPVSFLGWCGNPHEGTGWLFCKDQPQRRLKTCRIQREVSQKDLPDAAGAAHGGDAIMSDRLADHRASFAGKEMVENRF